MLFVLLRKIVYYLSIIILGFAVYCFMFCVIPTCTANALDICALNDYLLTYLFTYLILNLRTNCLHFGMKMSDQTRCHKFNQLNIDLPEYCSYMMPTVLVSIVMLKLIHR